MLRSARFVRAALFEPGLRQVRAEPAVLRQKWVQEHGSADLLRVRFGEFPRVRSALRMCRHDHLLLMGGAVPEAGAVPWRCCPTCAPERKHCRRRQGPSRSQRRSCRHRRSHRRGRRTVSEPLLFPLSLHPESIRPSQVSGFSIHVFYQTSAVSNSHAFPKNGSN